MKYDFDKVELKKLEIAERKAERERKSHMESLTEPQVLTNFQKKLIEQEEKENRIERDREKRKRTAEQKQREKLECQKKRREKYLKKQQEIERKKQEKKEKEHQEFLESIKTYCLECDKAVFRKNAIFCDRTCSGKYRQKLNSRLGALKKRGDARKKREKFEEVRQCLVCKKEFIARAQHPTQKFCSRKCSNNLHNSRHAFPKSKA